MKLKKNQHIEKLDGKRANISELKPGESIWVITEDETHHSALSTVYRPPRHRNESPIQYFKRTDGVVDNRYLHKHKDYYYCNPAHCKGRWKDKKKRDAHLDSAWNLLD